MLPTARTRGIINLLNFGIQRISLALKIPDEIYRLILPFSMLSTR
jgi:hypothetical protein